MAFNGEKEWISTHDMEMYARGKYSFDVQKTWWRHVRLILTWVEENSLLLSSISPVDLQAYICSPTTHGDYPKYGTRVARRAYAISLFDFLVQHGYAHDNPARYTPTPQGHHTPIPPLSAEELARFTAAAFRDSGPRTARLTGPHTTRNRVALSLMLDHGFRPVQVTQAQWCDLRTLDDGQIGIYTAAKGTAKTIELSTRTRHHLETLHARRTSRDSRTLILVADTGKPLYRERLYELTTRVGRKAGIDRPVCPYTLRRTYAKLIRRHAKTADADMVDVRDALNHSRVSSTERYFDADEVSTLAAHMYDTLNP